MKPEATPSSARGEAADTSAAERREHRRIGVACAGELLLGPLRFPCAIVDVSAGGAQLSLGETIAPLSPATLRIVNVGALHCRVVWNKGGRTGVRFLHDSNWVKSRLADLLVPA
ncbi:MAG: PilZ domain-containing protein [Alphaproteobacteria bacterium]|nr:PilZ domain-containing protein [Alphaproteobacteria bacterium]